VMAYLLPIVAKLRTFGDLFDRALHSLRLVRADECYSTATK
jgi:hypothetical protein